MLFKEWEVLLVDDEPDVLAISKLAMNNIEIYGLPLKIRTAASKAEAIEIIRQAPEMVPKLAVAFIDVVMETDHAGLELCQYIREELGNDVTQLYIRTGQPGVTTEREVMDRYDINGYFTKIEMTEDKLYSLAKSGVRQFLWSWSAFALNNALNGYIANSESREQLMQFSRQLVEGVFSESSGGETSDVDSYHNMYAGWMEGKLEVATGWNEEQAVEVRDRLSQMEGVALGPDGDHYIQDGNNFLIKIAPTENKAENIGLYNLSYQMPRNMITMLYILENCFSTLWKRAS